LLPASCGLLFQRYLFRGKLNGGGTGNDEGKKRTSIPYKKLIENVEEKL
jgi:hypothetical protein